MGVKASYSMKLSQLRHGVIHAPKNVYSKTEGQLSPFPFPFSILSLFLFSLLFWKLADEYKCDQPIGKIFPTPLISLCSGGG
jgi:hypothetical protein